MANLAEVYDDARQSSFLIVGIGASAGGVEALRDFFAAVPADSGIAYVVILHLSPEHESQLATILQTVTPLPVTQVTERVRVVPNHVYVVPPNQHLTMVDGEVTVSPNTLLEDRRAPVDIFFRTLAETHHSRAVCVVLSGTGADGSMGLKRVKERGGAVFVQNPREATFSEMPRNAIATNLVDDVLPVAAIPARIIAYGSRQGTIAIPMEAEEPPEELQQALREVLTHVRVRTGHDFSNYKRPTLLRRLERRINVRELPNVPAYAALLRENPDEVHALLKDLLISVTNFFRDKAAFTVLEQEILPRLFQGKRSEAQVRIWVAGCASGEEAYSIAMLCAERVLDTLDAPSIQIFATDIDEAAIAHAREGVYSATDTADVSPERLRRFFTTDDQRYRIRREIREMVLFANHNVLKDPPFSHLDLISYRNLLIYLNHTAQERVMETLHFALNPDGYLLLGTSESVDGATDRYTTVSREQHIYQSRRTGTRPFPVPESLPPLRIAPPRQVPNLAEADAQARERIADEAVHQRLLEEYAPPSAVVNADYDIVHLSERAGRYLQISGSTVSNNLLKLIRPELHVELRSALYQALQRQTKVDTSTLSLRIDDHTELVTIRVRPVLRQDDPARGLLLVIFEQATAMPSDAEIVVRPDEGVTRELEDEVQRLTQQLRTSSEQYEFQAEELKATNEEQQALNEELRSSNEELETSKEELQSLNEELRTVNQELKVKIEEANQTSANLQNLVNATNIGTIFLDRSLRVKLFTPSVRALFNLIPADYGRPLADITHRLVDVEVLKDAETVLDTLQPIEHEVRATNDQVFVLRVLPYRLGDDRIGGVVLTFVDITERKRAEEILRASEQRLQRMVNVPRVGVLTFDYSGTLLHANDAFLAMVGYDREEFDAQAFTWRDFTPSEHVEVSERIMDQVRETGRGGPYEKEYMHKDGTRVWMMFVAADLGDGTIGEYAIDLTDRKHIEEALRASEARLRLATEAAGLYTWDYDHRTKTTTFSPNVERIIGAPAPSNPEEIRQYTHPDDRARVSATGQRAIAEGLDSFEYEFRSIAIPNDVRRFYVWCAILRNTAGDPIRSIGITQDITERKRREANFAVLTAISADFASLSSAEEIMEHVGKRLAHHLNLSRFVFSEVDDQADQITAIYEWQRDQETPSAVGSYAISALLTETGRQYYAAGKLAVIPDTRNNWTLDAPPALLYASSNASIVDAPYVENGHWKFLLTAVRSEPGEWRTDETELIEDLAARLYLRIERAHAEAALRESEQRLRALIENLPGSAAFIVDRDLRYVLAEGEALHLAGFTPDHFVGKTLAEALSPELAAQYQGTYGRALAGEPFVVEHEEHGRSYITRGSPLRSASGDVYAALAVSYDITSRKLAEAAVRESEERFRLLVEGARDYAMFLLNPDNRITFWSAGAERVFGWSQDEAIGQSGSIIFTPEDRERDEMEREVQAAVTQGRAEDRRWHVRKDGTRLFVDGMLTRLDDENGQVRAFVKIGRDTTALHEAEDALQRAHDALETRVVERTSELAAANHLLQQEIGERRQLAAQRAVLLERILTEQETERQRIARELHDTLGQFLSALSMRLSMAQSRKGMPLAVREELAQLQTLSSQISHEVDHLTMELRPPALRDFGLPHALRSYAEEWSATSGIPVDVLVTGLESTRLSEAIETTVYRIVQEALTNVLKHAQASAVSVVVERRSGALRVIIEDNGVGFEASERIAHGSGGRQVGLIGMAERMTLVGGEVTIESMPGSGATIYLHIPLGEDTAEGTGNAHA